MCLRTLVAAIVLPAHLTPLLRKEAASAQIRIHTAKILLHKLCAREKCKAKLLRFKREISSLVFMHNLGAIFEMENSIK